MNLETSFLGMTMQSPIMVASGPASHDVKQATLAEEQCMGGIVLKTACSDEYEHMRSWPRPRYKLLDWDKQIAGRSKNFTLYSYEQGYSGTLQDYWDFIRVCKERSKLPIIGSIFAGKAEDWKEMALRVEENGADAIELDISSPHRPGSLDFENTFVAAIKSVVSAVSIPVMVKLAAGVDVVHQSVVAEECGASSVTLCNRLRGLDIDIESQRPILHGYFAGIGGPWSKYLMFRHVAEVAQRVRIPISATGGIMTGEDAIKCVLLGASTIQVLSVILVNGWDSVAAMHRSMKAFMDHHGITSLNEIRGKALSHLTNPDAIVRWSGESKQGPRNVWHSD